VSELGNWQPPPTHRDLSTGAVHVWRISIDPGLHPGPYWELLSLSEQRRASRFTHPDRQTAYVLAHGALRRILGGYEQVSPAELAFTTARFGKPALARAGPAGRLEFNLSHSGDLALLAVARGRAVGVDVIQWKATTNCSALAERFFSPGERDTLRLLAGAPGKVVEGFFSAWSRKEAYLKATGYGLTRGLDHFDVSLAPGEPAALIADRNDPDAPSNWSMVSLAAGAGYSAALVAATPVAGIALFDAPVPEED
jgi:4'-phosphopantetheinyl transferase